MGSVEKPFIDLEVLAGCNLPMFDSICFGKADWFDEGVLVIIPVNNFYGFFQMKFTGGAIIFDSSPVVDTIGCV